MLIYDFNFNSTCHKSRVLGIPFFGHSIEIEYFFFWNFAFHSHIEFSMRILAIGDNPVKLVMESNPIYLFDVNLIKIIIHVNH